MSFEVRRLSSRRRRGVLVIGFVTREAAFAWLSKRHADDRSRGVTRGNEWLQERERPATLPGRRGRPPGDAPRELTNAIPPVRASQAVAPSRGGPSDVTGPGWPTVRAVRAHHGGLITTVHEYGIDGVFGFSDNVRSGPRVSPTYASASAAKAAADLWCGTRGHICNLRCDRWVDAEDAPER